MMEEVKQRTIQHIRSNIPMAIWRPLQQNSVLIFHTLHTFNQEFSEFIGYDVSMLQSNTLFLEHIIRPLGGNLFALLTANGIKHVCIDNLHQNIKIMYTPLDL